MPSIFLTRYNSADPLPLFKKKGISYLMPGEVGLSRITVRSNEFFFYPYAFLHMYIIAIATNLVAEIDTRFVNLFKGVVVHSIFELPTYSFRFANLTPESTANIKALGLQPDIANPAVFTGSPSPSHLSQIMALKPVDDRVRPGHVGSEGFLAWVYLMKGIQMFITARNNSDGRANMRYELKKSVKFNTEGDIYRIGNSVFKAKHGFGSGRSIITTNDIFVHPPEASLAHFPSMVEQLSVTKGTPETSIGFFFPYFRGMNVPDKTVSAAIFKKFFPYHLSDTPQNNDRIHQRIGDGVRQLAFSQSGMALSHIYTVLDTTMSMEDAKICLVLKGTTYVGTIVCCAPGTKVVQFGREYEAGPIREEMAKVDLLEGQAEKICALLNGGAMDVDGATKRVWRAEEFLTSRSALRCWNSIPRDLYPASDILSTIRDTLLEMDFCDVYPTMTPALLITAVTAMLTGVFSPLDPYPALLTKASLSNHGSIAEALTMFGPSAPTINPVSDPKTSITIEIPGADKSDGNLVRVEGKRPLRYLPVWSAPYASALSQWESITANGYFRMPLPRKNREKEFVDTHRVVLSISADEQISTLYNAVKVIVNDARAATKAGNKRKRGAENSEGRKRGKVAEPSENADF